MALAHFLNRHNFAEESILIGAALYGLHQIEADDILTLAIPAQ
jgi:hypothetical protein